MYYCPLNITCATSDYGSLEICITDYEACKGYTEVKKDERIREDRSRDPKIERNVRENQYSNIQYR